MNTPHSVQTNPPLHLPDRRRLGYAEYGDPNGQPVLFFHGSPGSSYIHADMAGIASKVGFRLIAVDRPGYGLSDPKPGRTFLDWTDDVAVLMDALNIRQFAIIGFSMGSIYALACAYRLADRVKKIVLVGAFAPLDVPGVTEGMSPMAVGLYALAQTDPDELRKAFSAAASSAVALIGTMSASVADCDKEILNERVSEFELEYKRALLGGIEGMASDFILTSGSWGFPVEEVRAEVCLWFGTLDQNTPPAMTHYLVSQLPSTQIVSLPNEGHCILYRHWNDILKQLA